MNYSIHTSLDHAVLKGQPKHRLILTPGLPHQQVIWSHLYDVRMKKITMFCERRLSDHD